MWCERASVLKVVCCGGCVCVCVRESVFKGGWVCVVRVRESVC